MKKKLILLILICLGSLSYATEDSNYIKVESQYKGKTSNKIKWIKSSKLESKMEPKGLVPKTTSVIPKSIPRISGNHLGKEDILKEGDLRISWLLTQLRGIDQVSVDASSSEQYNLDSSEKTDRKNDFVAIKESVDHLSPSEKTQDIKDYGSFAYEMKDTLSKLAELNKAKIELCKNHVVTSEIRDKVNKVESQVKELEVFEGKSTANMKNVIKEIVTAFRKVENDILTNKAGDSELEKAVENFKGGQTYVDMGSSNSGDTKTPSSKTNELEIISGKDSDGETTGTALL